jgi:tRNA threonylcarbamoyladenosine modification (KEOPS) complex  Pcc1 subunit
MNVCLKFIVPALLVLTAFTTEAKQYPNENQQKAAYLYQITKFVSWPNLKETDSPIKFCVYGRDPFFGALDTIHLFRVDHRELQINYINQELDIANCNILFIQEQLPQNFIQSRRLLFTQNSILTIGEQKDFAKNGGMIRFVLKDNRMDIEVNAQAAADAKIAISSNLIEMAKKVYNSRQN